MQPEGRRSHLCVIGERAPWTVGGICPLTQPLTQISSEHCVRFKDKRVRPGRS